MAVGEKVLPSLLDRLTSGQQKDGGQVYHSTNLDEYRDSVTRDLKWLLNAKAGLDPKALKEFPEVARSVLNYGTFSLCGIEVSKINEGELAQRLKEVIQTFEPRLIRGTLQVKVDSNRKAASGNVIGFEISARVSAAPFSDEVAVSIKTELDLETGEYGDSDANSAAKGAKVQG